MHGRKTEPYQVRIRVRRFADDEWDRVLEAIAARLGHAAALLDGELPPEIADDAAGAGLDLLPGGGEVGPRCDCPDDADPCKHSAAACLLSFQNPETRMRIKLHETQNDLPNKARQKTIILLNQQLADVLDLGLPVVFLITWPLLMLR